MASCSLFLHVPYTNHPRCIHGFPSSSRLWQKILPTLASRRSLTINGIALSTGLAAAGALAVTAMAASMVGRNKAQQASLAVKRGMEHFVQGDVTSALMEFDKALQLDPRQKPYLWQRGLALFYLNRFEDGAAQFREDVAVNPLDTEEALWCFLCEAQVYGIEEARKRFLNVGPDRRPVMQTAYEVFKDGRNPEDLMAEVNDDGGSDFFYSSLYTGLYHEVLKNTDAARKAITAACLSSYGLRSGDYMSSLARVHCKFRGWDL